MPQQVAEHGVHVGQRQDGVLLDDFLGGRPALEGQSDRVERDAGARHTDDAARTRGQRHWLRLLDDQTHDRKLTAAARSGKRVLGRFGSECHQQRHDQLHHRRSTARESFLSIAQTLNDASKSNLSHSSRPY